MKARRSKRVKRKPLGKSVPGVVLFRAAQMKTPSDRLEREDRLALQHLRSIIAEG